MKAKLSALLLLLVSYSSFGATWYVDCSASSNGSGSFASPYNTTSSLNWTTINTGNDDVLFKEGTTCTNAQLGAGSGFPTGLNVAGTSGDYIRIGVYNSADGTELLVPTENQKPWLKGDGTTRTEMVSLFGFSYTALNGFRCSGGSNSSGRGCIAVGAGAAGSDNVIVTNNTVFQGDTPTNIANYGITIGTASTNVTAQDNWIKNIQSSNNSATGILLSNVTSGNIVTENIIDAYTFSGTSTIGILIQSSNTANAVNIKPTVTYNTIKGGTYGIRYLPFSFSTTLPYLSQGNLSYNTLIDQTSQGMYLSLMRNTRVIGNKITGSGARLGAGAGIYFSGQTGFVDGADTQGTIFDKNEITNAGQFPLHLIFVANSITSNNIISGCGSPNLVDTFGRCIEMTRAGTVDSTNPAGTLSALTGPGITLSSTGAFLTTDVGRLIVGPQGNEGICEITSAVTDTATCNVLKDFTSTSLAINGWSIGNLSHNNLITKNKVSNAYGRQYAAAAGTEGVGIGLDDVSVLNVVSYNRLTGIDNIGIDINAGPGNKIIGNHIVNAGRERILSLSLSTVRRTGIRSNGVGAEIANNTIDCAGNPHGISSEHTSTGGTEPPTNGGIITATNNLVMNCSFAAINLNANDVATYNAYSGNARNYVWMDRLSFSSQPTDAQVTAQTLDGGSLTSFTGVVGNTVQANSSLCEAGTLLYGSNSIGDINCAKEYRTTIGTRN